MGPDVLLNPYERPVSLKVTRNVFCNPEKPLCTSETGPLLQKCPPRARTEGGFVLASRESVRDNIVFPLPDTQVVPQDLIKG